MINRIKALDWARAQAYRQLQVAVTKEAITSPKDWAWNVGKIIKGCDDVVVRVQANNISAMLAMSLMWSSARMGLMAARLAADMECQLLAVRRHTQK